MVAAASPKPTWMAMATGPELSAQATLRSDPEKYSEGRDRGRWARTVTYRFTTMPTAT